MSNKPARPSASPSASARPNPGNVNLGPNPTVFWVLKYTEDNFQRILKTVLESRTPVPKNFDEPRKKPLKARAPDVYRSKSHIDCYNFIEQCKDHFVMFEPRDLNQVFFAATYLNDQALFHLQ